MALTYDQIATTTVGAGGSATISFTNIPATYTDLAIKYSLRGTNSAVQSCFVNFNGSSSNFSGIYLQANVGTNIVSDSLARYLTGLIPSSYTASTFGNGEIYIPNYTMAINKSFASDWVMENNATASFIGINAGMWSNTATITSIDFVPAAGSFAQHSTATLYGIKNTV